MRVRMAVTKSNINRQLARTRSTKLLLAEKTYWQFHGILFLVEIHDNIPYLHYLHII